MCCALFVELCLVSVVVCCLLELLRSVCGRLLFCGYGLLFVVVRCCSLVLLDVCCSYIVVLLFAVFV